MLILAVLLFGVGITIMIYPEFWLRLEDQFRIKGERVYSDLAFALMRLRGFVVTLGGIFMFFVSIP